MLTYLRSSDSLTSSYLGGPNWYRNGDIKDPEINLTLDDNHCLYRGDRTTWRNALLIAKGNDLYIR